MAMVDIQSLFADIIESPRQRQQAMAEMGQREAQIATNALSGRSQIFAPLVGALAKSQGTRGEMLERSVGGLFGLDTRNESEKLQQTLQGADTTSAVGLERVANDVEKLGYGVQAASLRQQAAVKAQEEAVKEQTTETLTSIVRNSALTPIQQAQTLRAIGTGAFGKADDLLKYIDSLTESSTLARKTMQVLKPDGNIISVQTDQRGNFFNMQGEEYQIPTGAMVVEGSSITGTPEEMNIGDAEARQLRTAQVATTAVVSSVGEMLQILEDNPDINTIVSSAAAFANNIRAEARAMGNFTGTRAEVESFINPDRYTTEFEELGIRNVEMQSLINSLAYTVAKANDPSGRLSDVDVKNAIREIGASSRDAVTFSRVLRNVAARSARNFQIDYRTRTGQDFTGDLGLGNLPTGSVPTTTPTPAPSADPLEEARRILEELNLNE